MQRDVKNVGYGLLELSQFRYNLIFAVKFQVMYSSMMMLQQHNACLHIKYNNICIPKLYRDEKFL